MENSDIDPLRSLKSIINIEKNTIFSKDIKISL